VYNTVEDVPHKGCGLMFFSTLNDASLAVVALANMGREKVVAAEMMDYQSLKAVQTLENVPEFVREQQLSQAFILKILKNTIPGGQSVKVSCLLLVVNVEKVLLLLPKTFASKSKTSLRALKCLQNYSTNTISLMVV